MGLGLVGTMTGPLLQALHTMPNAIFAGVFVVVGVRPVVPEAFHGNILTRYSGDPSSLMAFCKI
jgi:zinc transporter ZupT